MPWFNWVYRGLQRSLVTEENCVTSTVMKLPTLMKRSSGNSELSVVFLKCRVEGKLWLP